MKKYVFALSLLLSSLSYAWEPTKPIVAYIGYGPGSGNESSFRAVSAEVERTNPNARFVIQNMPGDNGVIAMNHTYKLPPDGYTLNVSGNLAQYVLNEVYNREGMKYKVEDLNPIISLATAAQVIVAKNDSTVNNVTDLVKYLKTTNNNITVGLGDIPPYLLYGIILEKGNINNSKVQFAMYKGPMQAVQDVVGGHIEFAMLPLPVAAQLVVGGKVKLIGVAGEKRTPQFPNVQAVNEVIPGAVVQAMWNITLPKDTPKEVVDWYVTNFSKAIKSETVQRYFHENYMVAAKDLNSEQSKKALQQLRWNYLPLAYRLKDQFSK